MTTAAANQASVPARAGWTGRLWAGIEDTYAAILDHPFIRGLTSGDLEAGAFSYFITQDARFIRDYVKALALLAARGPSAAATELLIRHAVDAVTAETALHQSLAADLGGDPAALAHAGAQPTTQAYTSYLLATIYDGDFCDGLAAVLPCAWIYAEVGEHLRKHGSPDPVYQRWIGTYGGSDYQALVADTLDLADQVGSELTAGQEERARGHFATAARYEWMFWDAAWRRESWPV
jgi:thiaminase/transcriptional activator TenA